MIIAAAIEPDGTIGPAWGKADTVAVARVTDATLAAGSLGLLVKTFGRPGETVVHFDNLRFTPQLWAPRRPCSAVSAKLIFW